MQGLTQTLQAVSKVKSRLNQSLKLLGIAFVNHDRRNVLANEVVAQIRKDYSDRVFHSIIGINIRIEEAQVKRESILTYAPEDRGSTQYRELGREVLYRIGKR
jgi:cellulose biosynthesis protein BcsQ